MMQWKSHTQFTRSRQLLSLIRYPARACMNLRGIINGTAKRRIKKKQKWLFMNCEHLEVKLKANTNDNMKFFLGILFIEHGYFFTKKFLVLAPVALASLYKKY